MKVATAAQMKAIDETAIKEYGIPGVVLMENAGIEVFRKIEEVLGNVASKKICIFAGKGNNGGDGYVAARHLYNQGAKVKVFLLAPKNQIAGDAKINLNVLENMKVDILEVLTERDWDKVKVYTTFCDCLVDAMVGTGFKGELSGSYARAVEIINDVEQPVVAIDIPSGINADTGQVEGKAVKADYTVTLCLPKPGVVLYPGCDFVGQLSIADIGVPKELLVSPDIKQNIITAHQVKMILGKRPGDAHKGSCGRVMVLAGSRGLTGAAALTSNAALRIGAGLVTLGIADSLNDIMEVKLTEVMTAPLPEVSPGIIGESALSYIKELCVGKDVLAVGPGLGKHEQTQKAIRGILKSIDLPMVVDADGLNALQGCTGILSEMQALPIITPHPGEMGRLTGLSAEIINKDRIESARMAAAAWQCVVVLKGARTIVAYPDGEVYINITGNSGMATGGTGDVLTGVIAGLIAQGVSSHSAAIAGVYIHGLAGDIAASKGQIGLSATDVLEALPAAVLSVQQG